ncbi:MAG: hypothetical protein AB9Q17_13465 [Candidatus Reddybacter sp.]
MKNYLLKKAPLLGLIGTLKYYITVEGYYRLISLLDFRSGVTIVERTTPIVVSLTAIPERYNKLHLCIESLLQQNIKPDHIILWLSDENIPLPKSLTRLSKRGLEIRYCEDIRSYTKIVYTLGDHPRALVITADDDLFYPKKWLSGLYNAYKVEPNVIHCHRAHQMTFKPKGKLDDYKKWVFCSQEPTPASFLIFPTGAGGVLYPPNALDKRAVNKKLFTALAPTADDVWLKAMSILNKTKCRNTGIYQHEFTQIKGTQKKALWRENTENDMNDKQIKAVWGYFDIYSFFPINGTARQKL